MQIRIFEQANLPSNEEDRFVAIDDSFMPVDSPEIRRERYLRKMANDERRGLRNLLVANSLTVRRLNELRSTCTNFSEVIGLASRAATLSWKSRTEFRMPPLLLVGPPGVGKSYFTRRLAGALDTTVVEQSMTGADDTLFTGHSISWRGARAGIVARTLIEGDTASPVILIDEIDKPQSVGHADLLDGFHALLEPENARAFIDSYLEIPIRADKIIWVATANDVSNLKPSLRDRFIIVSVAPPTRDEQQAIIASVYEILSRKYGPIIDATMASEAIDALSDDPPRRMKLIIELALGFAVADRRTALTVQDIRAARSIAASETAKRRVGF